MRASDMRSVWSRGPRGRWFLVVAAVVAAVAAFHLAHPRLAPAVGRDPVSASGVRAGYHNRAILRPKAGREETPTAITGVIYDTEGSLVAGATVGATTFEVAGNLPTTKGSAQSDEHGRFRLPLAEGSYNLSAACSGYGATFLVAKTGDEVSLILPKSGIVEGHVYDERKEPVPHFTIDVLTTLPDDMAAPAPMWSKTFDSPDGAFRVDQLPSWAVTLRATAPGYAPAFSRMVRVAPSDTTALDLVLPAGCTLEGRVEDKSGAPVAAVFIDAERRQSAGMMGALSLDATSQGQSNESGRFVLEHVPMGQVLVRAYDGANAVTSVTVDITDCSKIDPVNLVMSRGGSVRGVVRGSDGKPLAGVRVTASHRSIGFVSTVSDAAGAYRFDELPPSVVRIEASQGDSQTALHAEVKEAEAIERDIFLPGKGSGSVTGRVSAGETALVGVRVVLVSNRGRDQGLTTVTAVTDAHGVYRASDLPEGSYAVNVASTQAMKGVVVEADHEATADLDAATSPFAARAQNERASPARGAPTTGQ